MLRDGDVTASRRSMLDEFQLELEQRHVRPDTVVRYRRAIREFDTVTPWGTVEPVHVRHLDAYLRELLDRGFATRTIVGRIGRVERFLRWADDRIDDDALPLVLRLGTYREAIAEAASRWDAFHTVDYKFRPDADTGMLFRSRDEIVRGHLASLVRAEGDDTVDVQPMDGGTGVSESDDPQADETSVRRYLNVNGPNRKEPASEFEIDAWIGRKAGASRSGGLADVDIPEAGLEVTLAAIGRGIEIIGNDKLNVRIHRNADSDTATFHARTVGEGVFSIDVDAYLGGTPIGSVVLPVAVAANVGDPQDMTHQGEVSPRPRDPGEVSLRVSYERVGDEGKVLKYQLFHDALLPFEPLEAFVADPTKDVDALVTELGKLAAGQGSSSAALRHQSIENEGRRLWRSLLPPALHEQFWEVAGSMKRLAILSDEDPIPWELMFPSRGSDERGFLVEWCEVVRWRTRKYPRPALMLPAADVRFVAPPNAPAQAAAEVEAIKALDPRLAGAETMTSAIELAAALKKPDFGMLHFSSHNNFDGRVSAVVMGDDRIGTKFLETAIAGRLMAAKSPLVFLNACLSAQSTTVYTEVDGWAQAFMGAGAGAFVGSLWLVRDSSARKFAEAFYGSLLGGETFGRSLLLARQESRNEQGDPTWLAYAGYGDPAATLH